MNILLIDPPLQRFIGYYRFYFPLGLTYIAAALKRIGHRVLIYDAEHDPRCSSPSVLGAAQQHHRYLEALKDDHHPVWSEYADVLGVFQPDLVGISVLTAKLASALRLARLTKSFRSGIHVVMGGEHVTVRPQDALSSGVVDYVVRGEGESAMTRLVQMLQDQGCAPSVIVDPLIEDIDSIPLPALDCLGHLDSYRPVDLGLMVTARGCPYGCTFCGLPTMWGRCVRTHSIGRVIQEITERRSRYGTTYFSFRNGTFTLQRRWVEEFCRRLPETHPDIQWECLTRVDAIDEALLALMRSAGCVTIRIGIESGSEEILRSMGKGLTLPIIRSAAEMLHRSGIFWSAYFMLGVPRETEATVRATLDLIREIDPPFVTLAKFTPLPGTDMYKEVVQGNLLDEGTTDWTWAVNQSFGHAFVSAMGQDRFLVLLEDAAQLVQEHNARHAKQWSDRRLKL